MASIRDIFNKTIGRVTGKRYLGLLPGNLPVNTQSWGADQFLNAQEISLYVNRALNKRAEKVSEIEWLLRDSRGDEIEKHPTLDVLKKPNKAFTAFEFWKLYQIYYDVVGEVYLLKDANREIFEPSAKLSALHFLIPTYVTPHFDKRTGEPTKYVYKTPETETEYRPEQVLYVRNPNPRQPLRGVSLLKAGVPSIQTEMQISAYHSRILENGGKVEGVFKFETPTLTENQLATLKDQYKKEYADARKAGIPLFLGGNADYVKTGLTPDELSYLEAKKMTLEDICILTGVPKSILASTNDVKFDNADADRSIFLRETIKPLLTSLTTALDMTLFPDDTELTFVDPTPENTDIELKEIDNGIKNYYMTINEAREKRGLDPIDNGDVILVPFNLVPLGTGATPKEPAEEEEEKGFRNKSTHPNSDPDVREMWGKMQLKRMDNREKPVLKAMKEYFEEQRDRIVQSVSPANKRVFRKKDLIEETMSIELEVKLGKEKLLPLMMSVLEEAGSDALTLVGSDYAFNITSDIAGWLDSRVNLFMNQINETTFNTLKEQFAESLASEEGRDELVRRIEDTYGNINESRAATIARTEVHNATQYGTVEGYKQSGLTTKIWVTVGDGSVRDSHASIDGEEKPIDAAFSNGLMFPGDPRGDASETVNCRCTI